LLHPALRLGLARLWLGLRLGEIERHAPLVACSLQCLVTLIPARKRRRVLDRADLTWRGTVPVRHVGLDREMGVKIDDVEILKHIASHSLEPRGWSFLESCGGILAMESAAGNSAGRAAPPLRP